MKVKDCKLGEKEIRQILSSNIKRCRQLKGLSQEQVAEKAKISACHLSDIETGKSWVSGGTLSKLANIFGVEAFELLKPQKSKPKDANAAIVQCLDDVSASLTKSLEKSVKDTIKKMKQAL